ncbi:MAG: hypothetical protein WAT23_19030 [Chromatiaceae bacterium]
MTKYRTTRPEVEIIGEPLTGKPGLVKIKSATPNNPVYEAAEDFVVAFEEGGEQDPKTMDTLYQALRYGVLEGRPEVFARFRRGRPPINKAGFTPADIISAYIEIERRQREDAHGLEVLGREKWETLEDTLAEVTAAGDALGRAKEILKEAMNPVKTPEKVREALRQAVQAAIEAFSELSRVDNPEHKVRKLWREGRKTVLGLSTPTLESILEPYKVTPEPDIAKILGPCAAEVEKILNTELETVLQIYGPTDTTQM